MEGRAATVGELRSSRMPAWLLGLIPLILIMLALGAFALLDGPGLGERRGPPPRSAKPERASIQAGCETAGIRCTLAPRAEVDTGQTTLNEHMDDCQRTRDP